MRRGAVSWAWSAFVLQRGSTSTLVACLVAVGLLVSGGSVLARQLRFHILPAEGLDAESAALLLSQEDGGDLPLRATMFVTRSEGPSTDDPDADGGRLSLLLEMNQSDVGLAGGHSADADAPSGPVRLDVFLYLLDADLGVVDAFIRVVQIEDLADAEDPGGAAARDGVDQARQGRLRYLTEVPVQGGAVEARVLVRARSTDRAALRRRPLDEPGRWPVLPIVSSHPLPVIVDGVFEAAVVDWARSSVLVVGSPTETASMGFVVRDGESQAGEPGADDVEDGLARTPLAAAVRMEPGRDQGRATRLLVELRSGDEALWSEKVEVESGSVESEAGWTRVPLTPPLAELGPGRYQLSMELADGSAISRSSAPLFHEILVRSDVDLTATPFAGEGRRLAIPARELAEETLAALRALALGDERDALRRLSAVEERAIAGSGNRLEAARSAQVGALARVAATPDMLLPSLDLYLRAYRARRADQDFLLTTHAREMTLALLDRYLRSETADPAEAAAFLAAMAKARSPGPSDASIPLLEWAIDLNPGAVDAAWLRGAVSEALGDIEGAVRWWRLASEHAGHADEAEIRLHLGIGLLRSETRRARREGQAVLAALSESSDWIGDGARAELARDALRRGEISEATSWADAATGQSDPSLQVMRSYLAFLGGEEHALLRYGDAGHRGQEEVPARRRYATAWQRRPVAWAAPEEAVEKLRARLAVGGR